jgi:phospholipase/carboxylesterase
MWLRFIAVILATILIALSPENAWTMNHARPEESAETRQGRLSARPASGPQKPEVVPSIETLEFEGGRTALVSVPSEYRPDRPAPLLVLLHGAGGDAQQALGWLEAVADEAGAILVAPQSEGRTWDVILGGYGEDVARIDRVLIEVFRRFAVDPARLAIGGFSDGASYALSLGLMNGDLFRHVVAFSPGFAAPTQIRGQPRFFVSHGTQDEILPIAACSHRLVPRLRNSGYEVVYREFEGGHVMPPAIRQEALDWLIAGSGRQ